MLTAAQVAAQLGLSARAVYDLAKSGALACYRLGVGRGAVRFDAADVEAYRSACRDRPPPVSCRRYTPIAPSRMPVQPERVR